MLGGKYDEGIDGATDAPTEEATGVLDDWATDATAEDTTRGTTDDKT